VIAQAGQQPSVPQHAHTFPTLACSTCTRRHPFSPPCIFCLWCNLTCLLGAINGTGPSLLRLCDMHLPRADTGAICTTATLCHLQVANMEEMRRSEAKESEVNHRFVEHMQWWGLADCHMYRQQWHTAVLLLTQQVAFAGEPLCWHQMLLTCKVVSY